MRGPTGSATPLLAVLQFVENVIISPLTEDIFKPLLAYLAVDKSPSL